MVYSDVFFCYNCRRNAYNMVVNKYGDRLYVGLQETSQAHLAGIAEKIEKMNGEAMLRLLKEEYDRHKKSFSIIREIFMHLDKASLKYKDRKTVHDLSLDLWRDCVVRKETINLRMINTLLDMIKKQRDGELSDVALIRSVIAMLVDLGPVVYIKDFEAPFLKASQDYYEMEGRASIEKMDCPEYLFHAEKRLKEESDRVMAYLHPTTGPKLAKVVEGRLVASHAETLITSPTGAISIIERDDFENLLRMYHLFVRVGCQDVLKRAIADNAKQSGLSIVEDSEKSKDPCLYVRSLLDIREKYDKLLTEGLNLDKSFANAINQAFESFINKNPRSPEHISLFMDDKLRKGTKGCTEEEIEDALDKSIILFRYLSEKDVFEKYYKQHLAKRLLNGKSYSDDAERSLLGKLKVECGYQFTSKLESMFNDIRTSRETMSQFKNWLEEKEISVGVDLNVQVLTTGAWPIGNTNAQGTCNLPRELHSCCESFKEFYDSAHSGRKLSWQTSMGTAEIRSTFGNKKHEISCSTHQMIVLMLLNDSDNLTYHEILQATGIPDAELKMVMQSMTFIKGKNILKKEPDNKDIQPSDMFSVNDNFTSKLYKIKIGISAAVRETETERTETREQVEEDRKPQIEAAIVRVMKSRKVLQHNDVITEVTRQLSSRFVPSPALIKKRIESLIDREYLERDATDRTMYRYVA